jgi:hypothetical protein
MSYDIKEYNLKGSLLYFHGKKEGDKFGYMYVSSNTAKTIFDWPLIKKPMDKAINYAKIVKWTLYGISAASGISLVAKLLR